MPHLHTPFRRRHSLTLITPAPGAAQPGGRRAAVALAVAALASAGTASAAVLDKQVRALADLSLQELMSIEVVSAGRRSQALADVASAVFVITRDDLLRAGVRAWPEALRMAPGVDVARISSSRWAIGVRGEAGRFSNKLQVLVDGRSIYSPLFSGVFWEAEPVPVADIERIEIIRGPAGAMWGANAVNGVINVITRTAQDLDHAEADVRVDSNGQRGIRVATPLGDGDEQGRWRLSASVDGGSAMRSTDGSSAHDDWRNQAATARFDGRTEGGAQLSAQAQVMRSATGDTWVFPDLNPPYRQVLPTRQVMERLIASGAYTRPLAGGEEMKVTAYALAESGRQSNFINETSATFAAEAQRSWRFEPGQQTLTLGLGTKQYRDRTTSGGLSGAFTPAGRSIREWSVFGQDEIRLIPDQLMLSLGARIDDNPYAGTNLQPSATLSWRESPQRLIWASVSQAVRVPSRGGSDADVAFAVIPPSVSGAPLPTLLRNGNTQVDTVEKVTAWQLGVRSQSSATLSWDATAFLHHYSPLAYSAPSSAGARLVTSPQPHLVVDIDNVAGQADTAGVELAADWQPAPSWRVQASLAVLGVDGRPPYTSLRTSLDASPRQLASLRVSYDMTDTLTLQAWLRHTGERASIRADVASVPSLTTADLNARWQVRPGVALSGALRNLGPKRRLEIQPDNGFSVPVMVERSVGVKAEFDL